MNNNRLDITEKLPVLLQKHFKKPVVILPFYGEFGYFIQSYVRIVHHLKAPNKIVCIHPGEEPFFPSASQFFYDWHDLFLDAEKCGFRNQWPIRNNFTRTKEETRLLNTIAQRFPEAQIVTVSEPLSLQATPLFPLSLSVTPILSKSVDIVLCARRRATGKHRHDQRNFDQWEKIISPLVEAGYSIGLIGKEETSYSFPNVSLRSWDYKNNTAAIIAMLRQTRLYIGTDTGPTQIAALTKTPMILFRHYSPGNPDLLHTIVLPLAQRQGFPVHIVEEGWQRPELIAVAALAYLKESSVVVQRSYTMPAKSQ